MRTPSHLSRQRGFSLLEVVVVIAVLLLALVAVSAVLGQRRKPRSQTGCVNNLKQVALAARLWSNDNGDQFPWQVSTNHGGTMEFAASPEVIRHFAAMSNELTTPMILICPADRERLRADAFLHSLANSNLSYFVSLDPNETRPQSILTGDRNIMGGVTNGALMSFRSNDVPEWASSIHHNQGNLALGDGSVQQLTDRTLRRQFTSSIQGQAVPVILLARPRTPHDIPAHKPPAWKIRLPVPLVGAVLSGAAFVVAWLSIRRRLLAP